MTILDKPMKGSVCMVTGATSGIGKVTALRLAQQGTTVVVVGRSKEKSAAAVRQIEQQTGNSSVEFMLADLSSQQDIRQLAEEFKRRYQRLDVLVNNAGAIMFSRQESVDGIEMTLALNHLSYFLLTNLLLEPLKSGAPSRIINVSSSAHHRAEIDFDDLQSLKRYRGFRAYARSKLGNLLFTYELARRLEGTGITVNALHPGLVATNLMANNGGIGRLLKVLLSLKGISEEEGAQTSIYLATSPEAEGITGQYFVKQKAVPSSQASYDKSAACQLWQASAELTGLAADHAPPLSF